MRVLKKHLREFPVVMRLRETPVPMPNTTVKTQAADDTWLETARESKWLPDSNYKDVARKAINLTVYPLAKRAANKE